MDQLYICHAREIYVAWVSRTEQSAAAGYANMPQNRDKRPSWLRTTSIYVYNSTCTRTLPTKQDNGWLVPRHADHGRRPSPSCLYSLGRGHGGAAEGARRVEPEPRRDARLVEPVATPRQQPPGLPLPELREAHRALLQIGRASCRERV